jgi:hypothetical protein
MTKEVWIFGDSFAHEFPQCKYSWPTLLKQDYKVQNFALGGSGPDYQISLLLNKIKECDTTNIDLIFFVSDTSRFNFSFLKTPLDQYLIKHIGADTNIAVYKKHKKFIRAFFQNYIFHSTYTDTEIIKIILFLRELGNKFNNVLIIPIFDDLNECLIEVNSTKNVYIVKDKFQDVESDRFVNSTNHLSKEVHQHVYKKLVDWLSTNEKIIFKKSLDKINNVV